METYYQKILRIMREWREHSNEVTKELLEWHDAELYLNKLENAVYEATEANKESKVRVGGRYDSTVLNSVIKEEIERMNK